jgi:hypothetical protein
MNNAKPNLPAEIRRKLLNPATPGGRHKQIVEIVCALVARGFDTEEIFRQVRPSYGLDVSDDEIRGVIGWASGKEGRPVFRKSAQSRRSRVHHCSPVAQAESFLAGFSCVEADLWEASPWRPLEDWRFDSLMFLAGMYFSGEQINIVTEFSTSGGKANPKGYGRTLERDKFMRVIRDSGTPQSDAGAWIRMNPTDGKGITDKNITAFRFALLECDYLPLSLQISLFSRLPLPINAILASGGKSLHAWVRVNAPDLASYRSKVGKMFVLLERFGIDQSNKNPSRLSRLVGAQRQIGATEDGWQRLLYLNPDNHSERTIL